MAKEIVGRVKWGNTVEKSQYNTVNGTQPIHSSKVTINNTVNKNTVMHYSTVEDKQIPYDKKMKIHRLDINSSIKRRHKYTDKMTINQCNVM